MESISHKRLGNVSHPATFLPETQDEIDIATVQKFLITIRPNSIVGRFLDEKRRVNHIAHLAKAQDKVVIACFLPAKNLFAFAVHKHRITK